MNSFLYKLNPNLIDMKMDLSFFTELPELTRQAYLEISALAPLSMVSSQPGTYFRSEIRPTKHMIYGLLENTLGWHFEDKFRLEVFKALQKTAKKKHGKNSKYADSPWLSSKPEASGNGFFSLLQFHLSIKEQEVDHQPMTYDDLWSMQLRTKGDPFIGGSRNYDARLERLITFSRTRPKEKNDKKSNPPVIFGDRKGFETFSLKELKSMTKGKVKTTSLKPFFPHYYSSPKFRGYVVPRSIYKYRVACTDTLAKLIGKAIDLPAAPPYLGSNDGWVEIKWNNHE